MTRHHLSPRTPMLQWFLILYALLTATSLFSYDKPTDLSEVYHYHDELSDDVWRSIKRYLLPADHPIKAKLDKLFTKRRATKNMRSLIKAGFRKAQPQRWTRVIVTTHPKFRGYIFKIYLDNQHLRSNRPEYRCFLSRCRGAEILRTAIDARHWNHLFKVPQKWIYPLPPHPIAEEELFPKYTILVEEDMELYPQEMSDRLWQSELVTPRTLDALFYLLQKLGFWDCAKPENVPFSKDGRIAFVDTDMSSRWPIAFHNLFRVLSPEMLAHWKALIRNYERHRVMPPS